MRRSNRTYMMFQEDALVAAQEFANLDGCDRYVLRCRSGVYANQYYVTANPPSRVTLLAEMDDDELTVYPSDVERAGGDGDPQHTHHPDDVAAGNLPTDTERAQGGDDDPILPAAGRPGGVPATITVREYLEGEEERPVFLHTHLGALQVTGINFFSDGPWLRTGHGWLTASWCVAYSDRLYFDKAEAERSPA